MPLELTHRDSRGRLQPGHPGGPGRPKGRRSHAHHWDVFEGVVTREEMALVLQALLKAACADPPDVSAARVLLDRALPLNAMPDDTAEQAEAKPDWSRLSVDELQSLLALYGKAKVPVPGGTP